MERKKSGRMETGLGILVLKPIPSFLNTPSKGLGYETGVIVAEWSRYSH
jgi:hypothetical protein